MNEFLQCVVRRTGFQTKRFQIDQLGLHCSRNVPACRTGARRAVPFLCDSFRRNSHYVDPMSPRPCIRRNASPRESHALSPFIAVPRPMVRDLLVLA